MGAVVHDRTAGERSLFVRLPRLVGSREAADDLVRDLPDDLTTTRVTLVGRDLLSGSPSFADQLIMVLLVERSAKGVDVEGAPDEFVEYLKQSAKAHRVTSKLKVNPQALSA